MASEVHTDQPPMRADAQRNRENILKVARAVIAKHGTEASLRSIARGAGVGLGTLYRHFPTRDALLQQILQSSFDELTERAGVLASTDSPLDALENWMDELAASTSTHQGLAASMVENRQDPTSSLHAACSSLKKSAENLLGSAQQAKVVRSDIEGADLMSLVAAIAWLSDREALKPEKRKRLLKFVMEGLKE